MKNRRSLAAFVLCTLFPVMVWAEPPAHVAEIYGKKIPVQDVCAQATCTDEEQGKTLFGLAFSQVLNEFIENNKSALEPTEKEMDAFATSMVRRMAEEKKKHPEIFAGAPKETAEQEKEGYKAIAPEYLRGWKTNKLLYDTYGGKVIFQQAGLEPLTAYRKLLEDAMTSGKVRLLDKKLESGFNWYLDEKNHAVIPDEEAKKFMSEPPLGLK